ncbi:MAG TPA: hypothetical protein DDW60_04275, partial [Kandleria vitulina]|nr:hypothetical protein [Kandleria vitulina]
YNKSIEGGFFMKNELTLSTSVYCYDTSKKYAMDIYVKLYNTGHVFSYELLNNWIRETIDGKAVMPEEVCELVDRKLSKIVGDHTPRKVKVVTKRNPEHYINVEYTIES